MKKIVMFDTSYSTINMGDFIINKSISNEMKYLIKNNFVFRVSSHTPINKFLQNFRKNYISDFCKNSDYKFLCGTNLFSMNLLHLTPNFNLNIFDIKNYKNSIAIGCGCADTNKKINFYTKYIYKKILSKEFVHSARDEQTKDFLNSLGFKAVNTGCATMWSLTKEHCKKIPVKKSDSVIFTLTDYCIDRENDQFLINTLVEEYKKVYFWIQGSEDLNYLKSFKNIEKIKLISPNIESYEEVLENNDIDYVGTRLHAGIFALQKLKRSLIIIVDNRARDIKKTYNIPTIERENLKEKLLNCINSDILTKINLDEKVINEWKKQFEE